MKSFGTEEEEEEESILATDRRRLRKPRCLDGECIRANSQSEVASDLLPGRNRRAMLRV